jgi:uncharacterized protein (TIGR03032 family)
MYLIVSCVGAYNDSGIGTGGFYLIDAISGRSLLVDQLDSTGLFRYEENYFRYVRALKRLFVYSDDGLTGILQLQGAHDVHDIEVNAGRIVAVSTGKNEVNEYDHFGNLTDSWNPGGNDDAWHLNCLYTNGSEKYITAFGIFQNHREWNGNARDKGILYSINDGKVVIDGLSGPHTPRMVDGKWWICDSHKNSVKIFSESLQLEGELPLGGFTRGMLVTEGEVMVGVNADRKSTKSTGARIVVINRQNLEVEREIQLDLPEIYDLLEVTQEFYINCSAGSSQFTAVDNVNNQAIENLQAQLKATEKELIRVKERYNKPNFITRFRNRFKGKS